MPDNCITVAGSALAPHNGVLFRSRMPFRLAATPWSRRASSSPLGAACAHLAAGNEQTLTWQCEVTRVAAPTGAEGARAAWMAAAFTALGWTDVQTDMVGNLIVRRAVDDRKNAPLRAIVSPGVESARGAVWVCAHLDTVFPDAAPVVHRDGGRLTGPGIGDNGRGLAALLAIADAMQRAGVETPHEVVLLCTVGEEGLGDLRGMKHRIATTERPPVAVIALDGAGDDRIVHTAVGSTRWRIAFRGAGGHSWADAGAPNPVTAVASVAVALQAVALPRAPRTSLTAARIGGGESINSIPREAWLELDVRSLSATVLEDLERTVRETVSRITRSEAARAAPGVPPLTSRIDLLGARPCGVIDERAPLVRQAMEVTRSLGITPRLATGSTDASVPIAAGIPAITIGAGGRGGGAHTPEEWYEDAHGVRGLQRALKIIAAAAGLR